MSNNWQPKTYSQRGFQPENPIRSLGIGVCALIDYQDFVPTRDWDNLVACLNGSVVDASPSYEETSLSALGYSNYGWVLAPNGFIYAAPYHSDYALKIDPVSGTATGIGSAYVGSGKWFGAALGADGKIYAAPQHINSIMVINPEDDSVTTIAKPSTGASTWQFRGVCAVGPYVFLIPFDAVRIIKIDTRDQSVSIFGSLAGLNDVSGVNLGRYSDATVGPDGMIYAIPRRASYVMQIDPETESYVQFGAAHEDGTLNDKHRGGCMALNGSIYAPPRAADRVLKIDPEGGTVTSIGGTLSNTWVSAALGLDGKIYCAPEGNYGWLVIDPADDSVTVSSLIASGSFAAGAVCFPSGVVGVPVDPNSSLAKITWGANQFSADALLTDPFNNGS